MRSKASAHLLSLHEGTNQNKHPPTFVKFVSLGPSAVPRDRLFLGCSYCRLCLPWPVALSILWLLSPSGAAS